MSEHIFPVPAERARFAWIDNIKYTALYRRSIERPDDFWAEYGQCIDWIRPYSITKNVNLTAPDIHIRWFLDGTLNAAVNCLDRHLAHRANQTAILWEGDDPSESAAITYHDLYERVCRLANTMRAMGVRKGDRVAIYLPMIPEAAVAMLACARIGAIHSVVFGGFSPESLASRIQDCSAVMLITADEGRRGGLPVPLKVNADRALESCFSIRNVIVVTRTGKAVSMQHGRDHWYHTVTRSQSVFCPAEEMDSEDPLFILYTSGSTGKPKGVVHTTGGYMVYVSLTHRYVFDYHDGEIHWCTADVGWVTGHSYGIYGPLSNGAVTLMFEGVPNYPSFSRFWEIVDKYGVNILYTAPTALRVLMREGNLPVKKSVRHSLRLLGSVGEPINPEAWLWYYHIVGASRCPIVDTWWQTETGGILITPLPGATAMKPGSAAQPFFGIKPLIVDDTGKVLNGPGEGHLCIANAWPGMMRTVFGDHQRFVQTYFSTYPGLYFTGDGARRDADGYYWITGRVDDVINVSGHRLGTAEIESALTRHSKVVETAVVGYPHDRKGQGIYAYVILVAGEEPDENLQQELVEGVRKVIGPIATPDVFQWVQALPKTRSGKIMRRILRKIAANETDSLDDLSTIANPEVVDLLIKSRLQK